MNRLQSWIIITGILLATVVVFLPRQLSFDYGQGGQSYYFRLGVPLLTQIFLLVVVATLTVLAAWGNRPKA